MESLEETPRSGWLKYVIIAGLVIVALAIFGVIGQISGAGWFGYRTTLYGSGDLYALNMSPEPLFVSVDGREAAKVPAENAEIVELIGGESSVVVTDAEGETVGRYDVTTDNSHAFVKLTDHACLAAVDITPYYGGKQKGLKLLEKLDADTRVWVPNSKNVVWPRKPFPGKLDGDAGRGVWVELVACELFDEPDFLRAYLDLRLRERMKKALGEDAVTPPPRRR